METRRSREGATLGGVGPRSTIGLIGPEESGVRTPQLGLTRLGIDLEDDQGLHQVRQAVGQPVAPGSEVAIGREFGAIGQGPIVEGPSKAIPTGP